MGFIDGIEGYLYGLEELNVFFLGQGFRGDIQQFGFFGAQVFFNLVEFRFGKGGIHHMGNAFVGSEIPDGIHLVFHQGD